MPDQTIPDSDETRKPIANIASVRVNDGRVRIKDMDLDRKGIACLITALQHADHIIAANEGGDVYHEPATIVIAHERHVA